MAHNADYIPTRDADFDGWFLNYQNYVVTKTSGTPPAWTHIPAEKVTALAARYDAWHAAYLKTVGPHTRVDTEAKNDERKAAKAVIRPFTAQYLKFDPVTNEDRTAMGVHNKDTIPTPSGVPATVPVLEELKPLGNARVEIRVHDEKTPESRAIPYGCNGCVVKYAWGKEPITDRDALTQSRLITRFPYTLDLPPEASGSVLSITACWQNRDLMGRPSGIACVVVS
ncbi:hypothetical protein LQZ21_02185 [Treponema sp. TIM-1]|uniref:hypothetical protein n=1 Tax=Treponema sp. TIM-1 TaxID=2898417 RepID=UPI00397FCDDE